MTPIEEGLEMLLKELERIKTNQQSLKALEEQCKIDIQELLKNIGLDDYKSEDYGSIRKQRRAQKYYGEEVEAMEDQLKMTKKLADDMGDFIVQGYTESLVYLFPKDII